MRALFVLTLRQMLGGRKVWILAVFLSLPTLLLLAVLGAGGLRLSVDGENAYQTIAFTVFLYMMYPQALSMLATLLYGGSLLAGEIEDKTLAYLFTRGLPRWKVLAGKYLATATVLTAMVMLGMSVSFVLCGAPMGIRTWLALAAAIVAACFTFTAIFCLLGLLVPRRAIPIGVFYALVVEFALSTIPAMVNELTATYYIRSLAWRIADIPLPADAEDFERELAPLWTGASGPHSLLALLCLTLVTLTVSAAIIHRKQWPLTEDV